MTLVEVMIAMVILLVVALALMQTAVLSIDSNMRNLIRDEAVNLANASIEDMRVADDPTPGNFTANLQARNIRADSGIGQNFYSITNTVADAGDLKRLTVRVEWEWKGQNFNYELSSITRTDD